MSEQRGQLHRQPWELAAQPAVEMIAAGLFYIARLQPEENGGSS
jgi:hypothetical protein